MLHIKKKSKLADQVYELADCSIFWYF